MLGLGKPRPTAPAQRPAAADPLDTAITRAARAYDDLSALLEQETESLRRMKIGIVAELLPRKAALSAECASHLQQLGSLKDQIRARKAVDPKLLEPVTEGNERYLTAAHENTKALQRAQGATQKVVDLIIMATRKACQAQGPYARPTPSGMARLSRTPLSLSLNQSL